MISPAILHYCKYQERCHQEVRNKLYELGCRTKDVEEQISELIEKNIINEERFARAYARGKFRMNKWGKEKIKQQLRFRKVSEYCIRKGFEEINGEEYDATVLALAEKKYAQIKLHKNIFIVKSKLYKYLIQKGYEKDIVTNVINVCINENQL
jgi:regulatory protein